MNDQNQLDQNTAGATATELNETAGLDTSLTETTETPSGDGENVTGLNLVACSSCGNPQDAVEEYSMLQTGKRSPVCKTCRAISSGEWTRKRADYRKAYQTARRLQDLGYPVIAPNAKDWTPEHVLVLTDGRPALEVYEADKLAKQQASMRANEERQARAAEIRAARKAEREAKRLARLAEAEQIAAQRKVEREQKAAERAAQAAQTAEEREAARLVKQAEREAAAAVKAAERAQAAAERAAQKQVEREQKAAERAAAALVRQQEREAERVAKAEARAAAAAEKAAAKAASASQTVAPSTAVAEAGDPVTVLDTDDATPTTSDDLDTQDIAQMFAQYNNE